MLRVLGVVQEKVFKTTFLGLSDVTRGLNNPTQRRKNRGEASHITSHLREGQGVLAGEVNGPPCGNRLLTNRPRDRPVGGLRCHPGDQEKTSGRRGQRRGEERGLSPLRGKRSPQRAGQGEREEAAREPGRLTGNRDCKASPGQPASVSPGCPAPPHPQQALAK